MESMITHTVNVFQSNSQQVISCGSSWVGGVRNSSFTCLDLLLVLCIQFCLDDFIFNSVLFIDGY